MYFSPSKPSLAIDALRKATAGPFGFAQDKLSTLDPDSGRDVISAQDEHWLGGRSCGAYRIA